MKKLVGVCIHSGHKMAKHERNRKQKLILMAVSGRMEYLGELQVPYNKSMQPAVLGLRFLQRGSAAADLNSYTASAIARRLVPALISNQTSCIRSFRINRPSAFKADVENFSEKVPWILPN